MLMDLRGRIYGVVYIFLVIPWGFGRFQVRSGIPGEGSEDTTRSTSSGQAAGTRATTEILTLSPLPAKLAGDPDASQNDGPGKIMTGQGK
jgi:hypothetical protein